MSVEHWEKIPDLRDKFLETYSENLQNEVYDDRDLDRIRTQDEFVIGYLRHQGGDLTKAAAMMDTSLQWRKKMGLNDLRESSFERWMHEAGAVFFHSHDKDGHKILYFRITNIKKDPEKMPTFKQFIGWWIDKHYLHHPGEKIVMMFDMTDAGLGNVDVDLLKFQITCFTTYFPYLLEYMLVYEMPWILNAVWKIVKTILSAEQQKKVIFIKKNGIQKYFNLDQLWKHMGGNDEYVYTYIPSEDSGIDVLGDPLVSASSFSTPVEEVNPDLDLILAASGDLTTKPSGQPDNNHRKKVTFAEKDETQTLYNSLLSEEEGLPNNFNSNASEEKHQQITDQITNSVATISPGSALEFCITGDGVTLPTDVISIRSNLSEKHVAFKVKTTTLGRYKVRPAFGVIKPHDTTDVIITLEDNVDDPSQISKDKFLIICQEVEPDVQVSQVSELIRAVPKDQQHEHRLRVVMTIPGGTESPGRESSGSPTQQQHVYQRNVVRSGATGASGAPPPGGNGQQLNEIRQQAELKRHLDRMSAQTTRMDSRFRWFGVVLFLQFGLFLALLLALYWVFSPLGGEACAGTASCTKWTL